MSLKEIVERRSVCVCIGPGGVGKTTVSASAALAAALAGRKACVITVDPARRLANALGLEHLTGEPTEVSLDGLERENPNGELWAMMLDPKGVFDRLITGLADDDSERDRVLSNRIYRQISQAVAGTQEFTAIAELYELVESGRFDLIVLDTPPSHNALDLIDAPERLSRFLDGRALKIFLAPTRRGLSLLGSGSALILQPIKRFLGGNALKDLIDFFQAVSGMVDGFNERARAVRKLLRAPGTAFVLVSSPDQATVVESALFAEKLTAAGIECEGLVLNRVRPPLAGTEKNLESELAKLADIVEPALAKRLMENFHAYRQLAEADLQNIKFLRKQVGQKPIEVPDQDSEVCSIPQLSQLTPYLVS